MQRMGRPPAEWLEYLNNHVGYKMTVTEIQDICGRSRRTISHSMRKYFGKPEMVPAFRGEACAWVITAEGLETVRKDRKERVFVE